jgi:peptidoglycan hydrolase CwlO-like protein
MQLKKLCIYSIVLSILGLMHPIACNSYDSEVYSNLKRSRDALLGQQAELQRAYDDVHKQIGYLNAKLDRLDAYMRQVNSALKDVEQSMRYTR